MKDDSIYFYENNHVCSSCEQDITEDFKVKKISSLTVECDYLKKEIEGLDKHLSKHEPLFNKYSEEKMFLENQIRDRNTMLNISSEISNDIDIIKRR